MVALKLHPLIRSSQIGIAGQLYFNAKGSQEPRSLHFFRKMGSIFPSFIFWSTSIQVISHSSLIEQFSRLKGPLGTVSSLLRRRRCRNKIYNWVVGSTVYSGGGNTILAKLMEITPNWQNGPKSKLPVVLPCEIA